MSDLVKRLNDCARYNTAVDPREMCLEAAAHISHLSKEVERLRAALVEAGNAGGGAVSDGVSTDFLMHVPKQVRLFVAGLKARAEAAEAEATRLTAERDAALERVKVLERAMRKTIQ